MVRRTLRRGLWLGLFAGLAAAVASQVRRPSPPGTELGATGRPAAVEPVDGGQCPGSHPVKGKRSSGLFHVPGGASYTRTHADRCYVDGAAAEADGLRPAKR